MIDTIAAVVLASAAVMLVLALPRFYAVLVRLTNMATLFTEQLKQTNDLLAAYIKHEAKTEISLGELQGIKIDALGLAVQELSGCRQEIARLGTLRRNT